MILFHPSPPVRESALQSRSSSAQTTSWLCVSFSCARRTDFQVGRGRWGLTHTRRTKNDTSQSRNRRVEVERMGLFSFAGSVTAPRRAVHHTGYLPPFTKRSAVGRTLAPAVSATNQSWRRRASSPTRPRWSSSFFHDLRFVAPRGPAPGNAGIRLRDQPAPGLFPRPCRRRTFGR